MFISLSFHDSYGTFRFLLRSRISFIYASQHPDNDESSSSSGDEQDRDTGRRSNNVANMVSMTATSGDLMAGKKSPSGTLEISNKSERVCFYEHSW
ncbi:unnamed protein product [Protopolystoma xenopodis]|uniref:Uncharacterized protein n=1 Tax=Protopolystoma xenopodis TaxID=117903 RepID=A0A3S5ACX2_9PLAT|nr:unnamed protein product [Protopolystoma xenopodis]